MAKTFFDPKLTRAIASTKALQVYLQTICFSFALKCSVDFHHMILIYKRTRQIQSLKVFLRILPKLGEESFSWELYEFERISELNS